MHWDDPEGWYGEEERLLFELLSINSEKVTVLPETIKKENVGDIAYRCR